MLIVVSRYGNLRQPLDCWATWFTRRVPLLSEGLLRGDGQQERNFSIDLNTCNVLTLQIKHLPDELRGQKAANGKLTQPNQTQLFLKGPGNKCEQISFSSGYSDPVKNSTLASWIVLFLYF